MDMFPGLPRDQRNAIVARAYERFGDMPFESRDQIQFSNLITGNLYVLTFRYTNGFVPPNPQQRDIMTAMGGGYAQDHILVSVVKIVKRLSASEVEIELEQPVNMSFRNGPTVLSDRFALHQDGHVKYFPADDSDETRDWNSRLPRWEHTRFPVLPVIVSGCDVPERNAPSSAEISTGFGSIKRRRV